MVNDTGTDKSIAIAIKIDVPLIGCAIRKNLEPFGSRVIAGHGRVHDDFGALGVIRILDLRMSEHPLSHVEPAIRPPGKAIEQFVAILQTESTQQSRGLITSIISIGVFQKK